MDINELAPGSVKEHKETPLEMIFGFVLLLIFMYFMGKVVGAY